MFRRAIVSLDQLNEAINGKCEFDKEQSLYEAGAEMVLREVAERELTFFREHTGPAYMKAQAQSIKAEDMREAFIKMLPAKNREAFDEYANAVSLLELESLDAGFIAGFVAGYRFLKELKQD